MVFKNIGSLMSLQGVRDKQGRNITESDLAFIEKAALVVNRGIIEWVGRQSKLPSQWKKSKVFDCEGRNMFPGFVDCHTHLIFAGDRSQEFEMRVKGKTYQEIAALGGGILSTVKATRKAKLEKLKNLGQQRVNRHLAQGVTSIEVKSGYGLEEKSEIKILKAAKALKGARIYPTFLGAHAIPTDSGGEDSYLQSLEKSLLKIKKQGLAQRVDIFVEKGYFSVESARSYLKAAQDLGFDLTIHADQMSRTGASLLGVELKARSVDHVICINQSDPKELADSQTVAVLLPTADFYLQCDYPKARDLIDQGVCVALATDFNPGTSPTQNIGLVALLARLEMKMTLPEVFSALTYGGAKALGEEDKIGALLPGHAADFFLSDQVWTDFFYDLSPIPVWKTFVNGKKVF